MPSPCFLYQGAASIGTSRFSRGISPQKVTQRKRQAGKGRGAKVALKRLKHDLPMFAEMTSQKNKKTDPKDRAAIRVHGEGRIFQTRCARHQRCEMTNARNKITEEERPMADAIKPVVHALDLPGGDVKVAAQLGVNKRQSNRAAQTVTTGYAGRASENGSGQSAGER